MRQRLSIAQSSLLLLLMALQGAVRADQVIASTFLNSDCYQPNITTGSCSTFGSAYCQLGGYISVSNYGQVNSCRVAGDLSATTFIYPQDALDANASFTSSEVSESADHIRYCDGSYYEYGNSVFYC